MKKNKWYYLGGALLIIILLLLYFFVFKGKNDNQSKLFPPDSTMSVSVNDELIATYNRIATLEDSLRITQGALNLCMGVTTVTKTVTTISTTAKKTAVQSRSTSSKGNTTPRASNAPAVTTQKMIVPASSPGHTEDFGLSGDKYKGVYTKGHGVTINEESHAVYYISNEELNSGEGKLAKGSSPILNGTDPNFEFYWDASKNLWIYESNQLITIARLLDVDHKYGPVVWSVYIGQQSQYNYPMYVPHEILKTGSSSARSALANHEVQLHNPGNMLDGADFLSNFNYEKK